MVGVEVGGKVELITGVGDRVKIGLKGIVGDELGGNNLELHPI